MKHIIKALSMGLLLGGALSSCNNNFEEGDPITYPGSPELCIYENDYTAEGGIKYTVNLTLNEDGDTICDITQYNTGTKRANTFGNGKVSYNKKVGMMTVSYDESPYDTPATAYLTLRNDLQSLIVTLYSNSNGKLTEMTHFNAVKGTGISYYGDWMLKDSTIVSINPDGTASTSVNGEETGSGTATISEAGGGATVTIGGTTYTFATNEKGQTYVTTGASSTYARHILTQPKNDWYEYAIGTYSNWLFGDYETILEYSPSRLAARFNPWLMDGSTFSFYWVIGDATVTPDKSSYSTGYTHSQEGVTYGVVYGQPTKCSFADGVFTFNMSYVIPGVGGFGSDTDTFTITELLSE